MNLKTIASKLKKCKAGNHDLKEIFVSGYEDEPCNVVRWCKTCGCVVVDVDYDGRTNPGAIRGIEAPMAYYMNFKEA